MKLIESSAEYIPQEEGLQGIYKQIERAGRICYKSEDKITDNSAEEFVKRMISSGHLAMLEHGTVHLNLSFSDEQDISSELLELDTIKLKKDFHTRITSYRKLTDTKTFYAITTNYRVLVENNLNEALKHMCDFNKFHEKRYTFKLVTSIGIVRELLRHRKFSFANESTRYCNYSKDKFDNGITFIKPYWYDEKCNVIIHDSTFDDWRVGDEFLGFLAGAEDTYKTLINKGITAQQAREVLPLCTKSELIMTGFESDWQHFFGLRLFGQTGKPHPDMVILCEKIKDECIKNNIMTSIFRKE